MYAIYAQDEARLGTLEDEEEGDSVDLNEAVEMFHAMREENPGEYERIASLRDGIRSARSSGERGTFVFCRAGRFQQLYLVDEDGEVVSRDTGRLLGAIRCEPGEPAGVLPQGHNAAVMRAKERFLEEVRQREADRKHRQTLSTAQRYALDELQVFFGRAEEDDLRAKVEALEATFKRPLSGAVQRELKRLRQGKVAGDELVKELERIYARYGLGDARAKAGVSSERPATPRVVCSEAFR